MQKMEEEKKVRRTRCEEKRFYLLRPEGKKKKIKIPDSIQQGLFLPRLAEGSVSSLQIASPRQQKLNSARSWRFCAEL